MLLTAQNLKHFFFVYWGFSNTGSAAFHDRAADILLIGTRQPINTRVGPEYSNDQLELKSFVKMGLVSVVGGVKRKWIKAEPDSSLGAHSVTRELDGSIILKKILYVSLLLSLNNMISRQVFFRDARRETCEKI